MKNYQIIITYVKKNIPFVNIEDIEVRSFETLEQAKNFVSTYVSACGKEKEMVMEFKPEERYLRADITLHEELITLKLNIINDDLNLLDEFCVEEAKFRLSEYFGIAPESISDNLLEDTAKSIRETIDYCQDLYDAIDDNIREVLNKYEEEL